MNNLLIDKLTTLVSSLDSTFKLEFLKTYRVVSLSNRRRNVPIYTVHTTQTDDAYGPAMVYNNYFNIIHTYDIHVCMYTYIYVHMHNIHIGHFHNLEIVETA
jgi:hypothetical protein